MIITKRKIDKNKLNSKVDLIDDKLDRLNITKILRLYSKAFKLNQYDTSITLLRQFQQISNLQIQFIKKKNLMIDFVEYMKDLSENFLILYQTFLDFTKRIDKISIPEF